MISGIEYFKSIYSTLPNWVEIMDKYNPEMLTKYTEFRAVAFRDSEVLSAIEKDELIAALNAGRLYKRSMLLHMEGAQKKGSHLENCVEYMLVASYYNKKEALECGLLAIKQFIENDKNIKLNLKDNYEHLLDVLIQIKEWMDEYGYDSYFVNYVLEGLNNAIELRELVFQQGVVSTNKKYLAYVGMFITELDGSNAYEAIHLALKNGVSEAELAELGYIIIFTAGIPTWFELSDYLGKGE